MTIFAAVRNEFREFQSFSGAVILWLVCSAVCDVLIAVVLTYSLVCGYLCSVVGFPLISEPSRRNARRVSPQSTGRSTELSGVGVQRFILS